MLVFGRQAPRPRLLLLFAVMALQSLVWTQSRAIAAALVSDAHDRRIDTLVKQAQEFAHDGLSVRAYLALQEAVRLEQLWTNNTVGEEGRAALALDRFSHILLRQDSPSLMKVLHSPRIALGDKLGLLKLLEEDVILNFPGIPSTDLIQGAGGGSEP